RRPPRSRRGGPCRAGHPGARPSASVSCVAPPARGDVLEDEVLLVEDGGLARARVLPGGDIGEVLVVALGLAVVGLALGPEMAAAALGAVQRIEAHELRELEEVRDAAGLLQRLVQR